MGVVWPAEQPVLSDRDRQDPTLPEVKESLPDW